MESKCAQDKGFSHKATTPGPACTSLKVMYLLESQKENNYEKHFVRMTLRKSSKRPRVLSGYRISMNPLKNSINSLILPWKYLRINFGLFALPLASCAPSLVQTRAFRVEWCSAPEYMRMVDYWYFKTTPEKSLTFVGGQHKQEWKSTLKP